MKAPQLPEQHYRIKQLAERFAVSPQTVRRWVENRCDVKIAGETRGTKSKRRYRTILVPQSVVDALCREMDMNY